MTQEIETVEGSEIVVSEVPKTALVMSEKKAQTCAERVRKGLGSAMENLRTLAEGSGWIPLGYENWDDMCFGEFGYAPSSARRIRATAFLQRDIAGLLQSDNAQSILNRMPEESMQELKPLVKNAPEQVTRIVEAFANENHVPTTLDVLETIPGDLLTEKQRVKLAKLLNEDNETVIDYTELAENLVESIRKNLNKLFDGLYSNLDYPDPMSLVRDRFSELRAAFVDEDGYPYAVAQQEEDNGDGDNPIGAVFGSAADNDE